MRARSTLGWMAWVASLACCTGADLGQDEADLDASVVHVELEARRAGVVRWPDGRAWSEPGPLLLEAGTTLVIRSTASGAAPEDATLRVGASEVIEVSGEQGVIRRFHRGAEVDEDAVVVACDEDTARGLAMALGEDVTVTLRAPQGYQLDGPAVLARAARASATRRVSEVLLVRSDRPRGVAADAGVPASDPLGGALGGFELVSRDGLLAHLAVLPLEPSGEGVEGERAGDGAADVPATLVEEPIPSELLEAADLVGLYRAGERELLLDAEGGYVLAGSTRARARGSWAVQDGRLVLQPFGDVAPRALGLGDDGSLIDGGALRFQPVLEQRP